MHHASVDKSPRLKRVYERLQQGAATTREIIQDAHVCAVNSIIAELRANGIEVACEYVKKGVYRYRLERLF